MFFDPYTECRTDGVFRDKLFQSLLRLEALERQLDKYSYKQQEYDDLVVDILRLCRYNIGFLVPYFFPKYPYDKPMSLQDRPFTFAMMNFQVGGSTTIRASRQIGKSTAEAARELIYAHIFPGLSTLYVVPHAEHLSTFANKMRDMERAFRFPVNHPDFRQNLTYKEYPNGSKIEMIRVLTDSGPSRGKTADVLTFDETQHMDASLEPDIEQVLRSSKIASRIYAGTSTTTTTMLEAKWEASSRGTWHIRAGDGKHWINCGDKEEVIKIIKPLGPTCPYTSKILDVSDGEFVHEDRELADSNQVGLHVPQIAIPEYCTNLLEWDKLYQQFQNNDLKKFLEEAIGIPSEEGAREITLDDLKGMCILPETIETLQKRAEEGRYPWVISGLDWGGSDYQASTKTKQSYTVHCVLGITPDHNMDVLHYRRYSGMGYREIINQVVEDHVRLNGGPIASDFGVGQAYNMLLREHPKIYADKHIIFGYVGPGSAMLSSPRGDSLPNQFSLNKTDSVTQLFYAIKRTRKDFTPNPRIRCADWMVMQSFLMDFMNLYRAPNDGTGASAGFRYIRHGSKPDDALHAMNFAYVLARLVLREPLLEDLATRERLEEIFRSGGQSFDIFSGLGGVVSG